MEDGPSTAVTTETALSSHTQTTLAAPYFLGSTKLRFVTFSYKPKRRRRRREKAVAAGNQRWEGPENAEHWGLTPQAAEDHEGSEASGRGSYKAQLR